MACAHRSNRRDRRHGARAKLGGSVDKERDLRQRSVIRLEPRLESASHGGHILDGLLKLCEAVVDVGGVSEFR